MAVALFLGVHDARFSGTVGVFVHQQKILARDERLIHHQLSALLID
jgi:hypothetical protein